MVCFSTNRNSRLDFTMCNPPFYQSRDELISSAKAKQRPPFSVSTLANLVLVHPYFLQDNYFDEETCRPLY